MPTSNTPAKFSDPWQFPFDAVADLTLVDCRTDTDRPVAFRDLDYMLDLDRISAPMLSHHKATIVLITPAPPRAVRRFVHESSLSIPIFSDAPRSLYTALNMNFRFDSKLEYRVASRHVRTTVPEAWVKGFVKGVTEGLQGDPRQQGGSFVLGPGLRTCTFAHFDRFNADHVPIPDLLTAVGIADWKELGVFKFWDEMTEEERGAVKSKSLQYYGDK